MKSVIVRSLQASACLAFAISAHGAGITFDITYTAAVQNDANFVNIQNAVNYVESEFIGLYADPVTLKFTIAEGAVGLGESLFSSNYFLGSYAQLRAALIADATSASDATATAIANLPVADPYGNGCASCWYAPSAEAKALGLAVGNADPTGDGTYTFDNSKSYTYDPLNRQVAGKFDFIGVTEHEFSELMGRTSQSAAFGYDILDTMRFTAVGVREPAKAANVYFSFDNGNTNLAGFNAGGGDRQDFDGGVATDPFNAGTSSNQGHLLNGIDVQNMDVIGWNLVAPEPGTWSLIGLGLLAVGGLRSRKAARV